MRIHTLLAVSATTFLLASCAQPGSFERAPRPVPADRVSVQVSNHNLSDVVVYIAGSTGMQPRRLGMVTTSATSTFEIPSSYLTLSSSVRLIANPIGVPNPYVSEAVSIWPGERLTFTIENLLALSTVTVR